MLAQPKQEFQSPLVGSIVNLRSGYQGCGGGRHTTKQKDDTQILKIHDVHNVIPALLEQRWTAVGENCQ